MSASHAVVAGGSLETQPEQVQSGTGSDVILNYQRANYGERPFMAGSFEGSLIATPPVQ